METIYLIFVILLFALAIFDLVVGVSNDAVNFLNSAIGAKVASWRTIMIVASVGIFAGAVLSSGMMEVARKGIFNPAAFSFEEIMMIFMAVMLTDIILLDTFNSLGLPTSTTVSIVFELLGAAVALSLIKMTAADEGLAHFTDYINGAKALQIIGGILLSVVVAFAIGAIVQYVSRLIFSFEYKKRMKYVGAIWTAVAMTFMTYFLLIKGMKHATFISKEQYAWMQEHTLVIMGVSLVVWFVVMQALLSFTKVNILKLVVLFGTFSLAMAFAGNDLVNFIGVPIAGFQSFVDWSASGVAPGEYGMASLAEKVETPLYLLLIAGVVMVLTLWFSKKARSVTETTVKLSRQSEGAERFQPNTFSRGIVRMARAISMVMLSIFPKRTLARVNKNFEPIRGGADGTAFDLIRASVNLFVASLLIAQASSLKLPLSTTYVSFMVAMGASLADRAWGRDSAVYRVAGVISVIAGWFGTALSAFTVSAVFAIFIYYTGPAGVFILAGLAALLVIRSTLVHKRREAREEKIRQAENDMEAVDKNAVKAQTLTKVTHNLAEIRALLQHAFKGLTTENLSLLNKAEKHMDEVLSNTEQFKYSLHNYIRRIQQDTAGAGRLYLKVYDFEEDLVGSAGRIVSESAQHVRNVHNPLKADQVRALSQLDDKMATYLNRVVAMLESENFSPEAFASLMNDKSELLVFIDDILVNQSKGIQDAQYGSRNSLLFFSVLLNAKDIVAVAARFVKLYYRMEQPREVLQPSLN